MTQQSTGRRKMIWLVAVLALLALLSAVWITIHGAPSFHDHPQQPRDGAHWHFANSDITESSGVAASRQQQGAFWTINDSGNDPVLYAFDMKGTDFGTWHVKGAENRDWEALTLAPCGEDIQGDCLFIAETGDNDEVHPSTAIYRVPEPDIAAASRVTQPALALGFTYEDGAHDVEAIFLDAQARLNFVTKGRSNGVALYQLPADVWTRSERVAARIASFAIDPESKYERKVTDASLSPDGAQLALRTYDELYLFDWPLPLPAEAVPSIQPARICDLAPYGEEQGEAIAWLEMSGHFLLTSESDGKISLAECRPNRA